MKFIYAKRLLNGDEVILKDTGESMRVLDAWVASERDLTRDELPFYPPPHPPIILIEAMGDKSGYGIWTHLQVR